MSNSYQSHKPPVASGGLYLKLEDGQTVVLRLATEPYIFQNEYLGKWSTRYAWVVYNQDEEVAQVLQLSPTTYRAIAAYALDAEYGDPTQYNLKLTRNGTGTDTTYTVVASPKKEPLTADQKAKVDKIELTEVKGLEHAVPISEITDGNNAPKPEGGSAPVSQPKDALPTAKEVDDINLEDIPF
jgi:hypothetical protein